MAFCYRNGTSFGRCACSGSPSAGQCAARTCHSVRAMCRTTPGCRRRRLSRSDDSAGATTVRMRAFRRSTQVALAAPENARCPAARKRIFGVCGLAEPTMLGNQIVERLFEFRRSCLYCFDRHSIGMNVAEGREDILHRRHAFRAVLQD